MHFPDLPKQVDYNFHIRPLLSDRCYKCHGPDAATRETAWRVDLKESALGKLSNTKGQAFVSHRPGKSMAWERIISEDPEFQMPPPDSHLSLSDREKAIITRWIEQGAIWKKHWAFEAIEKPSVPAMNASETGNEIDHFIRKKLEEIQLKPSPSAEKSRLLRRVTMDLTGLPPTIPEIDDFLNDSSPDAYEKVVNRLLRTDAHAERLALEWMDVARYADSHGLHADGLRMMWPWRDWVIEAFKKNMAYDDFVTWQIAGDLLPQSSREQKLATGFHRNHVTNSELGIVPEEFRLQYVADRTNTTATAFMGLTTECASCHDHKFDPISQKEYYQMTAFFNNVHELGMIGNDKNWGPTLLLPDRLTEQQIDVLDSQIDGLLDSINEAPPLNGKLDVFKKRLNQEAVAPPNPAGLFPLDLIQEVKDSRGNKKQFLDGNRKSEVTGTPVLLAGKVGNAVRLDSDYDLIYLNDVGNFNLYESFSAGAWIKFDEQGTFQTIMGNIGSKNDGWRGWVFYLDTLARPGVKIVHSLSHNYLDILGTSHIEPNTWHHVFFTYDGSTSAEGLSIYIDGLSVPFSIQHNVLYKSILPVKNRNYVPDPNRSIRLGKGTQYLFTETDDGAFIGALDQISIYHDYLSPLEVFSIFQSDLKTEIPVNVFSSQDYQTHFFYRHDARFQKLQSRLSDLRKKKFDLLEPVMEVMVLAEMEKPRKTHVLERGQYDQLAEEVTAGTPISILPFPEDMPQNRLGLAQWLFRDDHPLTARVAVNRYWQMIFGRGIVKTAHDFGSQGALPTHPELLDWLAVFFRESGWDLRVLLKKMVMSATYRQSSRASAESLALDPENEYLSRGANYRWPAEFIRDNALAASGLLHHKIGGESVKPYQPPGLWKEKNEFSGYLKEYVQDTGQNLYRRSMYTFIRRTSPPPYLITFDATDRAVCTVNRERTNTPLQALILMNDPQFVEAAKVLAVRMQKEGGSVLEDQIQFAFRSLCGRFAAVDELKMLQDQYEKDYVKFQNHFSDKIELLNVGAFDLKPEIDKTKTAALTMVANTIMNFDEFYMKR